MALLDRQVAFVTGGADGIGLAVARRLAAQGARVMIADVREDAARAAAAAARADGLELRPQVVDVTDEASLDAAVRACEEALGPPTVGIANAGILAIGPALELPAERFRAVLEVNLTGAFLSARACARAMVAAGAGGSIAFTSSIAGIRGLAGNAAYSASKFGVVGLAQVMAVELAPHGIRVNAICPGQIDSAMFREAVARKAVLAGGDATAAEAEALARIPLGRPGAPEEVADAFVWLASDLARYVTGQSIAVDGGWTVG